MSKKAKSAAKLKRKAIKKARRETQRATYAGYAAKGQNTKSFRSRKNDAKARGKIGHPHEMSFCGNLGCKQCYPRKPKGPSHEAAIPFVVRQARAEHRAVFG